jgi:hypothetical protein
VETCSNTWEYIQVINLINVIYVIKSLYRAKACRNTLEHIPVINLINVIYVVKCLDREKSCSNTWPVCVLMCPCRFWFQLNSLSHISHL